MELAIGQKAARFTLQRLCEAADKGTALFNGPG